MFLNLANTSRLSEFASISVFGSQWRVKDFFLSLILIEIYYGTY